MRHLSLVIAFILFTVAQAEAAKLQLKKITCNTQEDITGSDDPYIKVKGKKVWGQKTKENISHDLSGTAAIDFTGSVFIALFEEDDLDPDDKLGTEEVKDSEAGKGVQSRTFMEDDAEYIIEYEVTN